MFSTDFSSFLLAMHQKYQNTIRNLMNKLLQLLKWFETTDKVAKVFSMNSVIMATYKMLLPLQWQALFAQPVIKHFSFPFKGKSVYGTVQTIVFSQSQLACCNILLELCKISHNYKRKDLKTFILIVSIACHAFFVFFIKSRHVLLLQPLLCFLVSF